MKDIIALRSKAKSLSPILRIGKSGLTESMLYEIEKNLSKRSLIKIKLLRASFDKKSKDDLINSILQNTHSKLVESVGNIVVIFRA